MKYIDQRHKERHLELKASCEKLGRDNWNEGNKARDDGKQLTDNPYTSSSVAADFWLRGFMKIL